MKKFSYIYSFGWGNFGTGLNFLNYIYKFLFFVILVVQGRADHQWPLAILLILAPWLLLLLLRIFASEQGFLLAPSFETLCQKVSFPNYFCLSAPHAWRFGVSFPHTYRFTCSLYSARLQLSFFYSSICSGRFSAFLAKFTFRMFQSCAYVPPSKFILLPNTGGLVIWVT